MANLTITVDDEVLKKARVRAIELGTSVNALLAEHLRALAADRASQDRAVRSLLALAVQNRRDAGTARARRRGRRRWTRADLHER